MGWKLQQDKKAVYTNSLSILAYRYFSVNGVQLIYIHTQRTFQQVKKTEAPVLSVILDHEDEQVSVTVHPAQSKQHLCQQNLSDPVVVPY